jgi:hypothetical protein
MTFAAFMPFILALLPVLAPVVTQAVKKGAEVTLGKIPSPLKPVVNVLAGVALAAAGDVVTPATGAVVALTAGKVYEVNKAKK